MSNVINWTNSDFIRLIGLASEMTWYWLSQRIFLNQVECNTEELQIEYLIAIAALLLQCTLFQGWRSLIDQLSMYFFSRRLSLVSNGDV